MWEFKTQVRVEIYSHQFMALDAKVTINWMADMDVRDWGIKSIDATCRDEDIDVEFEAESEDGKTETKTIKVNLSKLKVYYHGDNRLLYPDYIDLWIDEDGTVDYSKSEITYNT